APRQAPSQLSKLPKLPKLSELLSVEVVGGLEPPAHFVVDIFQPGYGEPVSYPVFLCEAARVQQPPLRACRTQRQSEVDSSAGRWLDLSETMIAIERHDRLTRTGFHVLSNTEPERQQAVVKRPQPRLTSRVHVLDVHVSGP